MEVLPKRAHTDELTARVVAQLARDRGLWQDFHTGVRPWAWRVPVLTRSHSSPAAALARTPVPRRPPPAARRPPPATFNEPSPSAMRISNLVHAIDAHACGEHGRVITGGVLDVPGATMYEKMCHLRDHAD